MSDKYLQQEDGEPRLSDDNDDLYDGDGNPYLSEEADEAALRDQLARNLEELIQDAYDWMEEANSEEARGIHQSLVDILEQLGEPIEDTDEESTPSGTTRE